MRERVSAGESLALGLVPTRISLRRGLNDVMHDPRWRRRGRKDVPSSVRRQEHLRNHSQEPILVDLYLCRHPPPARCAMPHLPAEKLSLNDQLTHILEE